MSSNYKAEDSEALQRADRFSCPCGKHGADFVVVSTIPDSSRATTQRSHAKKQIESHEGCGMHQTWLNADLVSRTAMMESLKATGSVAEIVAAPVRRFTTETAAWEYIVKNSQKNREQLFECFMASLRLPATVPNRIPDILRREYYLHRFLLRDDVCSVVKTEKKATHSIEGLFVSVPQPRLHTFYRAMSFDSHFETNELPYQVLELLPKDGNGVVYAHVNLRKCHRLDRDIVGQVWLETLRRFGAPDPVKLLASEAWAGLGKLDVVDGDYRLHSRLEVRWSALQGQMVPYFIELLDSQIPVQGGWSSHVHQAAMPMHLSRREPGPFKCSWTGWGFHFPFLYQELAVSTFLCEALAHSATFSPPSTDLSVMARKAKTTRGDSDWKRNRSNEHWVIEHAPHAPLEPTMERVRGIIQATKPEWASARVVCIRRFTQNNEDDGWLQIFLEGIGAGCPTSGCLGLVHLVFHRGYGVKVNCRLCRQETDLPKSCKTLIAVMTELGANAERPVVEDDTDDDEEEEEEQDREEQKEQEDDEGSEMTLEDLIECHEIIRRREIRKLKRKQQRQQQQARPQKKMKNAVAAKPSPQPPKQAPQAPKHAPQAPKQAQQTQEAQVPRPQQREQMKIKNAAAVKPLPQPPEQAPQAPEPQAPGPQALEPQAPGPQAQEELQRPQKKRKEAAVVTPLPQPPMQAPQPQAPVAQNKEEVQSQKREQRKVKKQTQAQVAQNNEEVQGSRKPAQKKVKRAAVQIFDDDALESMWHAEHERLNRTGDDIYPFTLERL